jgi:pantothenate synthetase
LRQFIAEAKASVSFCCKTPEGGVTIEVADIAIKVEALFELNLAAHIQCAVRRHVAVFLGEVRLIDNVRLGAIQRLRDADHV